jgi:AraC family transcriptional regulator
VAEYVEMAHHGIAAPPPINGKVVVSRLPAGESMVLSAAPAVKLVLDGEEIHEIDGRSYLLRPGRMLLVDRGAPYRVTIRRGSSAAGLCIYLPTELASPPVPEAPFLARALLQTAETNELGQLLARSARLFHEERHAGLDLDALMLRVRTALPFILAQATESMSRLGAVKASTRRELLNRLESARTYLHDHKDRAVPLTELASVAAMSSFQLTRYFSLAFGDPPSRYHRRVRLHEAAERLRRCDASITEIAFGAGYGELSAFTHAFSREFGRPPSALNELS